MDIIHNQVTQSLRTPRLPLRRLLAGRMGSLRPKTAESYRSLLTNLSRFLGHEPMLSELSPACCRRFSDWLLQRVQPSSAKTYMLKLRSLLAEAQRHGLYRYPLDHLPSPRALPKEPAFLTVQEVRALMATPCPHESTRQAFLFAVHTGLRLSDIETLQWRHITPDTFVVKEQVKTGRVVRVPLDG